MTQELARPEVHAIAGTLEKTGRRSPRNGVLSRIDGWYALRRTGQAVLVIALSYTLTFSALFILPGNPIQTRIDSPDNPIPPTVAESLLAYYHLDESGPQQFLLNLRRLVTNDWGYSLTSGTPVAQLIGGALPSTLALASTALILAVIISLGVSLLAVTSSSRQVRTFFESLPAFFLSVPSFLIGLLLLDFFSYYLGLVSSIEDEGVKSLILPALTLAVAVSAPISQVLIQGFKRVLKMPFVFVLRAQGNDEEHILRRHVFKNGSIPAITLLALTAGELLAGSVVTEVVFNRQGLGSVTERAVREQDTPVVLAVVLIVSVVFVLLSLITDLVYPLLDPRIRVSQGIATES